MITIYQFTQRNISPRSEFHLSPLSKRYPRRTFGRGQTDHKYFWHFKEEKIKFTHTKSKNHEKEIIKKRISHKILKKKSKIPNFFDRIYPRPFWNPPSQWDTGSLWNSFSVAAPFSIPNTTPHGWSVSGCHSN